MLPRFSSHNVMNHAGFKTKLKPDFLASEVGGRSDFTNLNHIGASYLCAAMTFSASHPSLRSSISAVILVGSEKEMVRANAPRVVAMVAHAKPRGDRSVVKRPRNPVCSLFSNFASGYTAIPVDGASCPIPARSVLINIFPEPLLDCHSAVKNLAYDRAAMGFGSPDKGRFNLEGSTALGIVRNSTFLIVIGVDS